MWLAYVRAGVNPKVRDIQSWREVEER